MKTKSAIPLAIAGAVILLACAVHALTRRVTSESQHGLLGWIDQIEWQTYDSRVKLGAEYNGAENTATNMATLFFTDDDFISVSNGSFSETFEPATDAFQAVNLRFKWPWPCFIHGQIVRELAAQGSVATGFDVLFPEADEINPLTDIPVTEDEAITSDEFFARQIAAAGNVYLAIQENLLPLENFRTNAHAMASISSKSDYGILRRVSPFTQVPIFHPILKGLEVPLGLELSKADYSRSGKLVIPTKKTILESEPAPFEVLLNSNRTLRLTKEGQLAAADEPAENLGAEVEFPIEKKRVWNLGLAMAAKSLGIDLEKAEILDDRIILRGPNIEREIPLDHEGKMLIDWSIRFADLALGKSPVQYLNLQQVLMNDLLRRKNLTNDITPIASGRIVIIGSEATGNNVTDSGATPLEPKTFLVTKHLNIANSLFTGRFVAVTPLWVELALIAFLASWTCFTTWKRKIVPASIAIGIVAITYIMVATFMYLQHRVWLAIVNPVGGGLLLPYFGIVTYRVMFEQREQRRVKGIFSKIVSPDVVQELLNAETLSLGGARQEVSVLFADVRGFTEFTDAAQATVEDYVKKNNIGLREAEELYNKQASDTLNTISLYLATIADMVKKHKGTLDKYIGDCVMAFWGAPVANGKHALCCVRAAVEAQRGIYAMNSARVLENDRIKKENEAKVAAGQEPLPLMPVLSLGTGINTGPCIVGLMGSNETILNYTVFGREVNLASRLEGVSGRGRIIISESTYRDIQRDDPQMAAKIVELAPTQVKGFRHAIRIFEVPWKDATLSTDDNGVCAPMVMPVPPPTNEIKPAISEAIPAVTV